MPGGEGKGAWEGVCGQEPFSHNPQLSTGSKTGAVEKGLVLGKQEEGKGQEAVHLGSGSPPRKANQFSTSLAFCVASPLLSS